MERGFVGGDLALQPLDLARQPVEVALVLVGEFSFPGAGGGARFSAVALRAPGLRPSPGNGAARLALRPILVAAGDDVDLARAVEAERDGHRLVEEVAVVADDQHRAVIIGDHFLQQVERLEVEVVGRLVEHQQVGRPGKFARQQQPRALAARQGADRRLGQRRVEQIFLQIALDVLLDPAHLDPVAALGEHVADAPARAPSACAAGR